MLSYQTLHGLPCTVPSRAALNIAAALHTWGQTSSHLVVGADSGVKFLVTLRAICAERKGRRNACTRSHYETRLHLIQFKE